MLVAQIRDEAHRFAITGMRARRASVRTGVELARGDSGRRAEEARRACCSASAARAASAAPASRTCRRVDGISHELAEEIYRALH